MTPRPNTSFAALVLLVTFLAAQEGNAQDPEVESGVRWNVGGYFDTTTRDDVVEWVFTGGVRYVDPRIGLDVRCERAMVVVDRQEVSGALRALDNDSGLPRRSPPLPDARRTLGEDVLRARMNSFLLALRQRPVDPGTLDVDLELFRSIYLEGDVSVVQDGVEVIRARSLYFSPADDRAVLRGVELRLRDTNQVGEAVQVTLRTDELVRQRGRMVGRDVSVTTCPAGVPQFEVLSGEVEILERADAFEIRARDNALAFSRTRVLPLPNQSYVTGEQTNIPIRSASVGHSSKEGMRVGASFGGTFNDLGGALHESLTGRSREEFRGDWQLGVEWIQERGFPIDGEASYRGGDVYQGRALGFHIDDSGDDIRDIRSNIDGSAIDRGSRGVVWTENRVHIGEHTKVDLTVFQAADAAVWSEFYRDRYYNDERPETSIHANHSQDNWIATVTGRWNLSDFSYADGRQLDTRFVEELPYATLDWFAEPIAQLPGETPLLLTSATGVAQLRSNYDDRVAGVDDETVRLDQTLELAAPFHAGPISVRPYADARFTHYDTTVAGPSADRWAFAAGIELGTRMSRTWEWLNADGDAEALRHVVSPTIRFDNSYSVDVDPAELNQFDQVDALDEGSNIRLGLLQRFQRRTTSAADDVRDVREVYWIDLAQNVAPHSTRDNAGHRLGLFEFEFIARPQEIAENVQLGLGTEGEVDWNDSELRTFNNFVQVRTVDVTWTGLYREDQTARGQLGYGLQIPMRRRWVVSGYGLYDLERNLDISYSGRLTRQDLNWALSINLSYDAVTDDISLRFEFEPKFGGLFRKRDSYSFGGYDFGAPGALTH